MQFLFCLFQTEIQESFGKDLGRVKTVPLIRRPDNPQTVSHVLPVAVRSLAEAVHRQGGLGGPTYTSVSGAEGVRLHQKLVRYYRQKLSPDQVESERRLQGEVDCQTFLLQISGRCDLLLHLAEGPVLIEAKSFSGPARLLPEGGDPLHWAQVLLYGCLLLREEPRETLTIGLAYLSQEDFSVIEHRHLVTKDELETFFTQTVTAFASLAGEVLHARQLRDLSAKTCRFPYPVLRPGQKQLMKDVIGTGRQKGVLFAQAPTGIGKTLSVLFPAVRLLANRIVDRVFYLTAMTSTRRAAEQALQELRANGLILRSLTLQAKEKSCLMPDLYCQTRQCPYATAYYQHLPAALADLFKLPGHCRPEDIRLAAEANQVCPFELSLDYALYCDCLIGDYNYAFDPRIQLERFFGASDQTCLLLVDEAHNLPDRAREMYSAALDFSLVREALPVANEAYPPLYAALKQLEHYGQKLCEALGASQPGQPDAGNRSDLRLVEPESHGKHLQAEHFLAMTDKPLALLKLLSRLNYSCREFLDLYPDHPQQRKILNLFLMAHFFCKVADDYYHSSYITTAGGTEQDPLMRLMCLDAAEFITDVYRDRHPVVFFSATLSPLDYYIGLLDRDTGSQKPETLVLPSPFPRENLLVLTETRFSTRYRDRSSTIQPIVDELLAAVRTRTGNYLVFLPSYAYLNAVRQVLKTCGDRDDLDFIVQVPNMLEKQKQAFLNRFEQYGRKTLVGLAVLGSLFNEGIDLVGERLSGVIIVGTGLPQVSPEREIIRQYFASLLGRGFEFAYQFPGFNKVQQAAGRVIRSETDTGFVLLIDDRYGQETYRQLFPDEWQPVAVRDREDLIRQLKGFWAGHKS
jgi:DNA excision repair protein ERCC-2